MSTINTKLAKIKTNSKIIWHIPSKKIKERRRAEAALNTRAIMEYFNNCISKFTLTDTDGTAYEFEVNARKISNCDGNNGLNIDKFPTMGIHAIITHLKHTPGVKFRTK